jgi:hypothetical protein
MLLLFLWFMSFLRYQRTQLPEKIHAIAYNKDYCCISKWYRRFRKDWSGTKNVVLPLPEFLLPIWHKLCCSLMLCKLILLYLKKNTRPEGVKTAPTASQIRRPSHQAKKTPTPPLHGGFLSPKWELGWCPPSALDMGRTRGFFNLSLKFAPMGSRTQDLRSAAGVLWPTGLEALWHLYFFTKRLVHFFLFRK